MPKVLDINQNTPEWLAIRADHIGASDVPVILMTDPFKGVSGAFGLFLEKSGQKNSKSGTHEATKHGHDTEDEARIAYAIEVGDAVNPLVVECTRPGWEFLMCSLDGWRHEINRPVELKCPIEAGTFRQAKEGHIPEHYMAQIMTQLFITETEEADYGCYFRGELVIIPVRFDIEWWEKSIAPEILEFWNRVQTKDWPKPEGAIELDGEEFESWAFEMADILYAERAISESKQKHIVAGLRGFCKNYAKVSGCGIEISRAYKAGYDEKKPRSVAASISTTVRRLAADREIF